MGRPSSGSAQFISGPTPLDDAFGEHLKLVFDRGFVLVGQAGRIVAGKAGVAILRADVGAAGLTQRLVHAVDADKGEAVGVHEILHPADVELVRKEFRPFGRIDAVEAAVLCRRAGDAHMDFGSPGIAHHLDDLEAGRAAHDAVIDQNDTLVPRSTRDWHCASV